MRQRQVQRRDAQRSSESKEGDHDVPRMLTSKSEILKALRNELARVDQELADAKSDARAKGNEDGGRGEEDEDEEKGAAGDEYGDEDFDETSDAEEQHEPSVKRKIKSRSTLKQASTLSSIKSRISQKTVSAKERAKLETLAKTMSAADVRAMIDSSSILRQAMLGIGVTTDDLLPGGLEDRFKKDMGTRLRAHLEKRRIETIVQVLAERSRLVVELEEKEAAEDSRAESELSHGQIRGPRGSPMVILSKEEQRRIFDEKLKGRRTKDATRDGKAGKLRRWQQQQREAAQVQQDKLRKDVETHLERASLHVKEDKERTIERRSKREARQARKMEICSAIKTRRRRAMEKRYAETEERLQALAQAKDPLKATSAGAKLNRSATEKLEFLQRKEAHRREVRESSQLQASLRARELRLEQVEKLKRLDQARERAEQKAQESREQSSVDEIDRQLRFERLQRRMEHERAQVQIRVDRKLAFAESLDQMQAELDRLRELARRDDFARAVARETASAEGQMGIPGPGEYNVGSTLETTGGKFGTFDLARVKAAEERASALSPGPGAYEAF
ncbi:Hypothetical Protein FCC1311_014192 [Hondaea fermentalgiana]|uniref:Uncharacterized protein n=1 Tax=Hondaea fermentalgiana TaxID=2315210 RepID=A0A2R5G2H9_9STRA|nr:Hypothetical Protein FCC1311_014192 [Hondaea fermentalgiana]|eukprot:GBG25202.1 Hypothetical Protein FCC1311_014192 [Hondaea fermentalgiana]